MDAEIEFSKKYLEHSKLRLEANQCISDILKELDVSSPLPKKPSITFSDDASQHPNELAIAQAPSPSSPTAVGSRVPALLTNLWNIIKKILDMPLVPPNYPNASQTISKPPDKPPPPHFHAKDATIRLLRNWKDQIQLNMREHNKKCNTYRGLWYMFGILIAVLAVGSSASAFSSFNEVGENATKTLPIVVGILGILILVAQGISSYFDFGAMSNAHHNSMVAYDSLIRFIDSVETTWDPEDDPKTILTSVRSQFDETVKNSAHLPLRRRVNTLNEDLISDPKSARGMFSRPSMAGSISGILLGAGAREPLRRTSEATFGGSGSNPDTSSDNSGDIENGEASDDSRRRGAEAPDGAPNDELEVVVESSSNGSHDNEDSSATTTASDSPTRKSKLYSQCKIMESIQKQKTESNKETAQQQGVLGLMRYQWQRVTLQDSSENAPELQTGPSRSKSSPF
jgi:hypothetical protein